MRIAFFLLGLAACLPNTELKVTKSGAGSGSVTSDPLGIDCGDQCTMIMDAEGVVELTATPAEGDSFRGWSGDCTGVGKCTIDSSFNSKVDARFEKVTTITVTSSGAPVGFTVFSKPAGLVCAGTVCSGEFEVGTDVELNLALDPMLHFDGWSGACEGDRSGCTVHVGNEPITTAAEFRRVFALTANAYGDGVVTGPGLSCQYTTCVSLIPEGDWITLTAKAFPTSTRRIWLGDCAGVATDVCSLRMTGARTATIQF